MSISRSFNFKKDVANAFVTLKTSANDPEKFHLCRSELFGYLKSIHSLKSENLSSPLYKTDEWLTLAEKIQSGNLFQQHTGSLNRLTPFASQLIGSFRSLEQAAPTEGFKNCLDIFAKCHQDFAEAYTKEIQEVYKNEAPVVRETHKDDIQLFITAILNLLNTFPQDQLGSFKEKIVNRDPEFVFLFPCITLDFMLQVKSENIPEIFQGHSEVIKGLVKTYEKLPFEEQESIRLAFMDSETTLSPQARAIYNAIRSIASRCQEQARLHTAILSNVYADLEMCLNMMTVVQTVVREPDNRLHSNRYKIILLSAILTESTPECFAFFKQIGDLRRQYLSLGVQEKEEVKQTVMNKKNCQLNGNAKAFWRNLENDSNQLAFSKNSMLPEWAFRLANR
jgi:hypothetical protein